MDGLDILVARRRAGLKQFELAQRAGMRPNELSLIENGRLPITPETLARITAALRQKEAANVAV